MKTAGQIALLFLLLLVYLSAAPALFAQPDFSALDINPKWNGASYDPGVLRFCDAASWPASTDCVGVSAAANSAAYTVRVPTTVGAAGEALVTDGNDSAQLSWAANSPGGCPAGAEDSIQLNRSSACAADDLTWSGSGLSLNPAGVEATLLQMGSVSSAQLGILDFRTSGFPGFDTRLSASGGETTDGLGTLTLIADSFTFAGNVDLKFLSSGVNDFGTSFTPAGKMFATFVQSGGLDREKAANVFFNARTSGFPGFDVRWSFGGGSTTDGLGDITLSAENFFFSTDVDFRFLVGDSNNWGTSFTPAGDGWWTNLDTTQTLMVDGNATFGGDIRFASDGTSDVGTTSVRAGDGYSDTWNSEVVRITNTGHTSHYALTWDSVYFNVARTDGVVSFRLTNADHKALFKGAVAAEADLHLLTDDGLDQWIWTTNVSDHLELKEVGGAGVVLTFDAFANKLNIGSSYLLVTQAISVAAKDIDCQGAAGCNLGGPWGDIDMRGFLEIESPNAQLGFKAESALGGGDANTGAWQVYNSAGLVRMHSWVNGDNSGLYLYNDASNLTAGLTTFGTLGGADSAYFFLKDGSNRTKIQMGVDSGGDPQLLLTEAGAGTDVVITLQNLFNGGDFAVADNEGRNKANVSIDGDGAPFFNLVEPGAGVSNGVVAKVIASGVTQGGNIVISDLNGTQRGYFGTLDNGASGTVSVNSAGVDVPLRSTSSTTTTGLLFDAVNVIERKAGTFSGACTTGTLGLNSSGGAGTSLYVCESSAWVGK